MGRLGAPRAMDRSAPGALRPRQEPMAKLDIVNLDGQKVGDIDLDDSVFAVEVKEVASTTPQGDDPRLYENLTVHVVEPLYQAIYSGLGPPPIAREHQPPLLAHDRSRLAGG